MANGITFGGRQSGLGPPAEMQFIPFPFEELASGVGIAQSRDTSKFAAPGEIKPKEGLLNIRAGGFDIPVSDQNILNSRTQQKDQEKQDLLRDITQNPNDPLILSKISKFKETWQNEENYGDTARILRNKEQADLFNKATTGKYNNPWTTIDAQEKKLAYALSQKEGKIIDLDLTTDLANLPKEELNRFQEIDNSLKGMSQNEIAEVADYLGGKNIDILPTSEGNFLINVEGKGYSENRVVNTIAARMMASDFQDDIDKQIRYEELQAGLSGQMFDRETRYNQIVNQSIRNYAIGKKADYVLSRTVKELAEPKEGLFGGAFLKSTIGSIGAFDVKIPEISSRDKFYFDSSGRLNHNAVNEMIDIRTKELEGLKKSGVSGREGTSPRIRIESEIKHLRSLTDNILKLREDHKVLSSKYESDRQFINAVKTATNASDDFKYEKVIPQIQILSDTMWKLASANPLVWGIKDDSTGEVIEDSANIERGEAAFSLDPIGNKAVFQISDKIYSSQLPDPLVSVFGTVKNITEGIQQSLNTDDIIEVQPFREFGDDTVIKIARTLENGKYQVKVKYDERIGYIDVQTYLSTYIEKLTPQISKIGKEMVKGAIFK